MNSYEEIAGLISSAFATNKEAHNEYSAEFLRSCYEYPGTDRSLSPCIIEEGNLAASLSLFPRYAIYEGREIKLALLTLNSVHPNFRSRGYGIHMITEAVRNAQSGGFDGALLYCVDGNPSNRTSVAGVKAAGVPCQHIYTVEYLMGLIPPGKPTGGFPAEPSLFRNLAGDVPSKVPFARTWTEDEAKWQCAERTGAVSECLETANGAGILTGYVMRNAKSSGASLIVEDILWDRLEEADRGKLLTRFLSRVSGQADVAVVPLLGYADSSAFRGARFRKSARKLNAYLSLWNGQTVPPNLSGMYMDVF